MFEELRIFREHGYQAIPDLRKPVLTPLFRGRPVIDPGITEEENRKVAALCPTQAIGINPAHIDLGKCVFCRECAFALLGKIHFTNDHRLATNDRRKLIIEAGNLNPITIHPDKIRKEIRGFFKGALKLRQVSAAGDNSAEMELNASGNVNFDMGRFGIEFVASPRHADGIVITGPISRNMSRALELSYAAIPEPKIVILSGSDAISGGIFNGSEQIDRSFLEKVPVDLYVPGNPPHPLTFILGVLALIRGKDF